jgi:hypothetical protein
MYFFKDEVAFGVVDDGEELGFKGVIGVLDFSDFEFETVGETLG